MRKSIFYYKELSAAEVGNAKTHEIYIRLPNNFDYIEFFANSASQNGSVIEYSFTAIDVTNGIKSAKNVNMRFVFFNTSNNEKRIPSLGTLFSSHDVKEGDIVCLESREVKGNIEYYIKFFKKGTITINPNSFYFSSIEEDIEEFENNNCAVNKSRQIIFYGAPGTGKSNKIEDATNDGNRIRTTFHPDSDYSTFVGAYKPTMQNEEKYLERLCDIDYLASLFKNDYYKAEKKTVAVDTFAIKYAEYLDGKYGKVSLKELCEKAEIPTGYEVAIRDTVNAYHACIKLQIKPNQIAYSFVPQAFLKAYVEAWKRIDKGNENPYYLIIEEINRGNCAQIFGDLFQLLDRNDEGYSRYAIVPDDDIKRHIEKELSNCSNLPDKIIKGEEMRLPSNLYIWATMNTSDQSLFPIDSAFKRRWDWEYMPIENANKDFVIDIDGTLYDWWDFISTINSKIDLITGSEDKKLGYWFAKPVAGKTSIDCQLFVSKVLFYLWNDVYKDYADSKDSIFRADNNGQSIKTPFTTFFGEGREDRVKAFMAFNDISPKSIKDVKEFDSENDIVEDKDEEAHVSDTNMPYKVTFPDGETICEGNGFGTFVASLRKIGLDKVLPYGDRYSRNGGTMPLVTKAKVESQGVYKYYEIDGYYVLSGTDSQHRLLKFLNKELNLGLTIQ